MDRLRFRYTRPPLTQGITSLAQVGVAIAIGAHPAAGVLWAEVVARVPESVLLIGVPWLVHLMLFWLFSLAFGYVNRYNAPEFIARYRIQSGPPRRPPIRVVLHNLAVNQLVLSPLLLAGMWGLLHLRGWTPEAELPGLLALLMDLAGMSVASILWFYVSHRFLHRPWWMKNVHRVHHEFRTSTAMASEYAHPVEFIFGSFGTLSIGVVLMTPSLPALYLYAVLALTTVLAHHSGYALPWMSWSVHHDWHHFRFKECFGTLGILDRVLGTDAELKALTDGETV
ncbi:MAG: sterol desaturase family protein [Myxococcota bacterium]|nr:sterol desaturase family protein [Myxococcota bacterium]